MLSLFRSLSPSVISDYWYGPIGTRTAAGIAITDESAMTYSAVWACTRVLSASGSCLPLNLHRRNGDMVSIASENPLQRLLHDEPNDEMGSMGLRSIGLMRQINNGNFYAEIGRDGLGRPAALWPLDNNRVTPIRPDEQFARQRGLEPSKVAWQIKRDDGQYEYLRDRDMLNVRSIISDDGITGKGVIQNARETIGHGIATVQQGAAYMRNSARPSVVITGGKFKTGEDRETYRRMWMDVHGGPENNAKPAMMPDGADVKVLSFSPEDSQFIQTLQHSIEDVARWYGVPPHAIGHLLRATFSNIEHLGIEFVVYSLVPWLKMWEEEINRKLLTPAEKQSHFAKHNVNGLLRGDSTARAAYYQSLWQLGAYSINEIRELEDLNPIPDGDQHFVQTSYTTLDKIGEEPQPAPAMPTVIEDDEDDDEPLALPINIQPPDVRLPDGLTAQLAALLEYTKPTECDDDRLAVIQHAAAIMLDESTQRVMTREIKAIERACSKEPAAFFVWLDEFYTDHESKVSETLRRPLHCYAVSHSLTIELDSMATNIAAEQIETAKEQVLQLTECDAEEWPTLGERFAELSSEWRETRSDTIIERLSHDNSLAESRN